MPLCSSTPIVTPGLKTATAGSLLYANGQTPGVIPSVQKNQRPKHSGKLCFSFDALILGLSVNPRIKQAVNPMYTGRRRHLG